MGGNIRGRNERLRGQIGVNRIDGWEGWIRGPDAEREYAVEPVGVERMSPSACTLVRIQWEGDDGFSEEYAVYEDVQSC